MVGGIKSPTGARTVAGLNLQQPTMLKYSTANRQNQPFDVAHLAEWLVAAHYARRLNEVVFIAVGYYKAFDAVTLSKRLRFEIKTDLLAASSFNLAFEKTYRTHPSGIAATQANVWVHCVPIGENFFCYEFDVETLRAALQGRRVVHGGDDRASELYLLPMSEAARLARRRFTLSMPNGIT
jgi:hypothetical protein